VRPNASIAIRTRPALARIAAGCVNPGVCGHSPDIAGDAPIELPLASGATARVRGPSDGRIAICLGGGVAAAVPGIWNASLEWLADHLEPRRPELGVLEVRYRIRSWRNMGPCIEDAAAALDAAASGGAREVVLIGFSMGGAVAVSVAPHPLVEQVIGLAPWLSDRLDMTPLHGRRLDVLHGSLDRWFPGVPGVPASLSQRGVERARALGVPASYRLVRGGVHGIAARTRFGLVRLPRAGEWLAGVDAALGRSGEDGEH
jgi:pimeloyl-ACP methyl ester carboxylesterase